MMDYRPLRIVDTREEIGGQARSLWLENDGYEWMAGQHLPIRLNIDGEEVRRQYSLSVAPDAGARLRITVKRVAGGLVSNFLNDHLAVGDVLEAAAPQGHFVLDANSRHRRTHYFFGAGSGITPLYAMMSSVIAREEQSVVHLCYGNHNEKTLLLEDDLTALAQTAGSRMSVNHVFSQPGWLSSFEYWRSGRVDRDAISALFKECPPYAQDTQYYICGPGGMNTAVREALMSLDVPAERIHLESFGGNVVQDTSIQGVAATASVTLGGTRHELEVAAGQTVLEAAHAAGLKPPYSCSSGVCGSCVAKLKDGEVKMRSHMALDDKDIKSGRILTCQSLPQTATLHVDYD